MLDAVLKRAWTARNGILGASQGAIVVATDPEADACTFADTRTARCARCQGYLGVSILRMTSRLTSCLVLLALGSGCGDNSAGSDSGADSTVGDAPLGKDTSPSDGPVANDASGDASASDAGASDAGSDGCPQGTYVDISAGQDGGSGTYPSAVIDTINGKLLVVTQDGANANKPSLFRCNLDGTSCGHTDISAGQGTSSGQSPSAVIDTVNSKLLVVTDDGANSDKPALFRCNLDGTSCAYVDISAGQGANSGYNPSAVIDTTNGKLLAVTQNGANSNRSALFRCNLDGTSCSYVDISASHAGTSGMFPSARVDSVNGKLLVVTQDSSNLQRPALFRCNLDGTSCTYSDLSANGQATCAGSAGPSAVIDSTNSKLLVVVGNLANNGKPALVACGLDGTSCAYADLSAGQGAFSGNMASAVVDSAGGKLLAAAYNATSSNKPALYRCNLDGSACAYTDISAGQGPNSGLQPSAVLDAVNHVLLVAVQNGANGGRPGLFTVCLP